MNKPESFFEAIPGTNDNYSIGCRFPIDGGKIKAEIFTNFKDKLADTVILMRTGANFSEDEFQKILQDNLPAADLAQLKTDTVAPVKTNALSYGDLKAYRIRDPETKQDYYIERGFQWREGADSYLYITTSSNWNSLIIWPKNSIRPEPIVEGLKERIESARASTLPRRFRARTKRAAWSWDRLLIWSVFCVFSF